MKHEPENLTLAHEETPASRTDKGVGSGPWFGDLAPRLREHADRVAGGGPSNANYDPETLEIEHDAADEIERLRGVLIEIRAKCPADGTASAWAIATEGLWPSSPNVEMRDAPGAHSQRQEKP